TTSLGASVTNLRFQSEGGFGNGRGTWLVAARRGYLDLALKLAGTSDSLSPVYADVFAKAAWTFSDRNHLALHALGATDALDYKADDGTIQSAYRSGYSWLTWDLRPADQLSGQTVVALSGLSWLRNGSPRFSGQLNQAVHDHRTFGDVSARTDWSVALGDRAVLKLGGETHDSRATYEYRASRYSTVRTGGGAALVNTTASVDLSPAGQTLGLYA